MTEVIVTLIICALSVSWVLHADLLRIAKAIDRQTDAIRDDWEPDDDPNGGNEVIELLHEIQKEVNESQTSSGKEGLHDNG